MNSINTTFLLTGFVIAVGYTAKRTGLVSEHAGKAASRIVISITLPALLLLTVSEVDISTELLLLPAASFGIAVFICLAAFFVYRKLPPRLMGIALMMSLGYNVGLFGFPIIESIYGQKAIVPAAMFDIGNAFIIFGLSYYLGKMYSNKSAETSFSLPAVGKALTTSPPFVSYVIGLGLNLLSIEIPAFIHTPLSLIASANRPLVLLILGIMLNFSFEKAYLKIMLKTILLRYVTGIALGVFLYAFLPFDEMYRTILFICLNLP